MPEKKMEAWPPELVRKAVQLIDERAKQAKSDPDHATANKEDKRLALSLKELAEFQTWPEDLKKTLTDRYAVISDVLKDPNLSKEDAARMRTDLDAFFKKLAEKVKSQEEQKRIYELMLDPVFHTLQEIQNEAKRKTSEMTKQNAFSELEEDLLGTGIKTPTQLRSLIGQEAMFAIQFFAKDERARRRLIASLNMNPQEKERTVRFLREIDGLREKVKSGETPVENVKRELLAIISKTQ